MNQFFPVCLGEHDSYTQYVQMSILLVQ